jgi:hypothetical protein
VVQLHCPTKGEIQCKDMIRQWLKSGVLFGGDYENPARGVMEKGLFVGDGKRPRKKETAT